jgi:hypothetical protein
MSPVPVAIAPGLEHETSNAITALQEWSLSLEGAMVTIDAMGRHFADTGNLMLRPCGFIPPGRRDKLFVLPIPYSFRI